jgi:hypothetical protein
MNTLKNTAAVLFAAAALASVHGAALADYVSPEPQYTGGTPALRADVARQAVQAQRLVPVFAQGDGAVSSVLDRATVLRTAASEPMPAGQTSWLVTMGEPAYPSFVGSDTPAQNVRVARAAR